jgi:hypothetical protein
MPAHVKELTVPDFIVCTNIGLSPWPLMNIIGGGFPVSAQAAPECVAI